MIWISTLCLVAIAAWLFFNALNERRWVEAYSHDETVASDEGLLPSFTARTRSANLQGDGKVSIDQENSGFARAVAVVQEKSAKLGDKFFEAKVAAARIGDNEDRPGSAGEENTVFGRMVSKVGAKAAQIDDKLDAKMKAASSQEFASGTDNGQGGTFFERTSRKVAQRSEEITQRVAHRAKNAASNYEDNRVAGAGNDDGVFGKMVNKVSSGINTVEKKVEARMASSRVSKDTQGLDSSDDLMTRVSAKVGNRINEIDEKIVDASKKVADKYDK